MTTAARRLKLMYWRRKLAWNQMQLKSDLRHGRGAARRNRIAEIRSKIHALMYPHLAPVSATGPDISNLQKTVDFAKIKAAGHAFVYLKAGEGVYVPGTPAGQWNGNDPTFQARVKAARHAGLKVGGYHFLRPKPGRTGAQEAASFVANLKEAGLTTGDLRPAADIEVSAFKLSTKAGRSQTVAYTLSFVKAVEAATGIKPLVYTYASFNAAPGERLGQWPGLGGYPLWIAAYQSQEPTLPSPWTKYAAWQFSDKTLVDGVGPVDCSRTHDLRLLTA